MPNRHRGDVDFRIDGRRYTLRLTLGSLARLEGDLQADDLARLGQRLAAGRYSARDILRLLAAGLEGGGTPDAEGLAASLPAEFLPVAADRISELLLNTFGEADRTGPPRPQAA